jgi:predicted TIM-barrel fold metal-dependent hydrolase
MSTANNPPGALSESAPDLSLYASPKIDCHCHILDPQGFAYANDVAYRPAGQETGSADYFSQVLDAYGVHHALLVEPNSGYGLDNRCMLDAIARSGGRFKGVAVVPNDCSDAQLDTLQAQGIVGIAFNVALLGPAFYADIDPLLERLAQRGMFAQVQVIDDQLVPLVPRLLGSGAPILIDHCGRPDPARRSPSAGDAGFAALLQLGASGRASVKLSGFVKFSRAPYPFADCKAIVTELLQAFGPDHCMWASDWPHLKAPYRLDYGPLLQQFARTVSDASMRHKILWETPKRLFGF